jgi:MFS family permease|tara:strand:+ start:1154 stop:2326 length:1173 start_codon:yes stop_codon:yes gene_type:complete
MKKKNEVLPIIVIAQFCCTCLWFAGNAVLKELMQHFNLGTSALEDLTSAVQFGFITGTLLFAIFTIVDRFSPSKVFFLCAFLGALANICLIIEGNTDVTLLFFRFLTGFFLAGIYPVGMKIATDYYQKGLGTSLGFIIGALTLGTALPHLLRGSMDAYSWKTVLIAISMLSAIGGSLLLLFVPDGPFRKKSSSINLKVCFKLFKHTPFRKAAFGYFGHMWELYAFWTFVPIVLKTYSDLHTDTHFNIPLLSFLSIGVGSLGCVLGSYLAVKFGTQKVAFYSLVLSGICCVLTPLLFVSANELLFVLFLFFWGMVVIADSPLFTTLVAQNTPEKNRGTALTVVNCVGFAITIISIQGLSSLYQNTNTLFIYWFLAMGPVFGVFAIGTKRRL